jgi:hypothetical protein
MGTNNDPNYEEVGQDSQMPTFRHQLTTSRERLEMTGTSMPNRGNVTVITEAGLINTERGLISGRGDQIESDRNLHRNPFELRYGSGE